MVPPRPHAPTNAHPAPHDAKRIASYSIRQRLTKRGTLFLAISHSARGMLYLCNVKTEQTLTAQQPPPQPSPLWEGVVSTAICENPVASVLSVFNSPLTLRTETIHPLRFARPTCLRGTVCYNRLSGHTYNL